MERPDNPYPVTLGELKPLLQQEACQTDRSLHWLIKKVLKVYTENQQFYDLVHEQIKRRN